MKHISVLMQTAEQNARPSPPGSHSNLTRRNTTNREQKSSKDVRLLAAPLLITNTLLATTLSHEGSHFHPELALFHSVPGYAAN